MPEDSGSTSVSTIWAAMAASTAEPPCAQHLEPGLGGIRIGRAIM